MFINPKYPGITATELSIKNWVIAQSAPYVVSIRAIDSKDTAIDANEYRVAFRMLRTTTDPASGQLEDYHFGCRLIPAYGRKRTMSLRLSF